MLGVWGGGGGEEEGEIMEQTSKETKSVILSGSQGKMVLYRSGSRKSIFN